MNRLDFLTSRDERAAAASAAPRRTLAEALDDDVAVLRVRCHWDRANRRRWEVVGFTAVFRRITYSRDTQRQLFAWLAEAHPGVDWNHDHHIDLRTGAIHEAPDAWEHGFIPDDDSSWGELRPPAMLPAGTSYLDPPALPWAPAPRRAA